MEQIKAKIKVCGGGSPGYAFRTIDAYLYEIQGVKILLHEDYVKKGTYTCTEYYSGRSIIKDAKTMQEALNEVNKRIFEKGVDYTMKKIKLNLMEEEPANKPDHCLWCGKPV